MSDKSNEALVKRIKKFPRAPGVYLMKDESGEVIYIGKARDIRARVRTYFTGGDGRMQIEALVRRIVTIEVIVTENEEQAFVLERDLIKKQKPRYNIKLKDDKAYLSVRIDENDPWPRLELVRKVVADGARYFGPYSSSYELRTLLEIVKRTVPLRTCANTVFYNRQRPCLEYEIKRCSGPCVLPVDRAQYGAWVSQAISVLEGKTEGLLKDLNAQMDKAASELRFEDAQVFKERIQVLETFAKGQGLYSSRTEDRDVFAIYREESLVALTVLRVRLGRIYDTVNFNLSEVALSDAQIIESAISQFYEIHKELPEEIVVPVYPSNLELLKEVLGRRKKTDFTLPKQGLKVRLLNLATINARQHFSTIFDSEARYTEISKGLAKLCGLKQLPRRVECIDISNLQGSDIVGACVAFFDGAPDKSAYRKYKITDQEKPDDFRAIFEVVQRRLTRGMAEGDLPDLMVIDGGQGQLNAALAARAQLRLELDIISLAKMRTERDKMSSKLSTSPERVFLEGAFEAVPLAEELEVTKFLKRLRDEAHRFVITFHRKSRGRRVFFSVLDSILGVGPERRQRLLKEFGSVDRMKHSTPEALAKAGRMPISLAKKVLRVLHG